MIDENKIRHDALHNHGRKQAYVKSLTLLRTKPIELAIELIFQELCRCEDKEMAIDRQLETLEPIHSCI
jgi:hypothetical protein